MSFSNLTQSKVAFADSPLFVYIPLTQSIISLNLDMLQHQLHNYFLQTFSITNYQMKAVHMKLSKESFFTLVYLQLVQKSFSESCNFTDVNLQICEGSGNYLKGYPSTYPYSALVVYPTLTFLNLGDFDPLENTVTVFVSLKTEWYDSRLSLSSTFW